MKPSIVCNHIGLIFFGSSSILHKMKSFQAVMTFICAICFLALTPNVFAHTYSLASVDGIDFEAYTHGGALYFQIDTDTPDDVETITILSNDVPAAVIPTTTLLKDQQAYDFEGTASLSGNITTPQLNEQWAQSGNTTLAVLEPTFDGNTTTLMVNAVGDGIVSLAFQMTDGTVKVAEVSLKPKEEIPYTPGAPPMDHSAHGGNTTSEGKADEDIDHSAHSAEEHAQYLEEEATKAAQGVENTVSEVVGNGSTRGSVFFATVFGAVLLSII
jgi:hypothetical protein